jgi:Protein of unknown function (DUF3551)
MRLVLASAALVAAFFAQIPAGQAQSGNKPWCAVVNIGWGDAAEICEYNTVEECQPNVIAGNRGFCNVNPRYVEPVKRSGKRHAKVH